MVRAQDAPKAPPAERHSPKKGYPSIGPKNAKTTLIFFTDYQCPVCPRPLRDFDQLIADFNGDVRIELHHNPLAMHKYAFDQAVAAKAAQRQKKFWEYHDALLQSSNAFGREPLVAIAEKLGLDKETFERDFDDADLRAQVTAEAKQAYDAKILGTPGFLVNGHSETGWASLHWIEEIIRKNSQ